LLEFKHSITALQDYQPRQAGLVLSPPFVAIATEGGRAVICRRLTENNH